MSDQERGYQDLIVSEVPEGEEVEEFVTSTLKFRGVGSDLPSRPLRPSEVETMRKTWVEEPEE